MKNRLPKYPFRAAKNQQGAVLLEALIAVLIFSLGILAISGLQAAMMKNTADATMRAEASYIVQQEMGKMLTYPVAFGTFTDLPVDSLPNGKLSILPIPTDKRLLFRVTWQVPGEPEHKYEAVTSVFTAR